jgi:DNA-binding LytR/AlgR family response regulator
MHHWLETAKVLVSKLKEHPELLDDCELKMNLLLFTDIIRQAESEVEQDEDSSNPSIVGQSGNVSRLLYFNDLAYCQSDDKKVFITDANYKVYRSAKSLKDIERAFPGLIRINQSTLIHLRQIQSIEMNEKTGQYVIRLVDGRGVFKVSRRCYRHVREIFRPSPEGLNSYLKAS